MKNIIILLAALFSGTASAQFAQSNCPSSHLLASLAGFQQQLTISGSIHSNVCIYGPASVDNTRCFATPQSSIVQYNGLNHCLTKMKIGLNGTSVQFYNMVRAYSCQSSFLGGNLSSSASANDGYYCRYATSNNMPISLDQCVSPASVVQNSNSPSGWYCQRQLSTIVNGAPVKNVIPSVNPLQK